MSNVLQGLGFQAGLNRDIFAEQKAQLEQAGELAKQKKGGLLGSLIGGKLGKFAVDKLLGTYLKTQFGPMGVLLGKAIGTGLGAWGGTKLGVGRKKDVGADYGAGTGLLGSGYERLGKLQDSISGMAGAQGLGAGVGTFVSGLGSLANVENAKKVSEGSGIFKSGGETFDFTGVDPKVIESFKGMNKGMPESEWMRQLNEAMQMENFDPSKYLQQGGPVGYQHGGEAMDIQGATPYSANINPEGIFQQIMEVPASQVGEGDGMRYYLGEAMKPQLSHSKRVAGDRAMFKMQHSPQDSIPSELLENYFSESKPKGKKGLLGLLGLQMGGMPGTSSPIPYQNGGEAGLQYAEDYEYSPSGLEKILDVLPLIGGKRAYDRAEKYIKDVHWNPEDEKIRDAQMKRKSNVFGKASTHYMEENDLTTKDDFQERTFVETDEDPRNFGYRNIAEKNNLTNINQFIHGSPSGHIMETDDIQDYAVDPYNIAKSSEDYKGILGMLGIPRYSGSVKKNPGIDPYIDPSYFKEQIKQTDARRLAGGGYLRQYNLGGSVAQQPMSYQIGGLLKYKRNPMVG